MTEAEIYNEISDMVGPAADALKRGYDVEITIVTAVTFRYGADSFDIRED